MWLTCLLAGGAAAADAQYADEIYRNGDFLTGAALTTAHPTRVTALAVRDGRVLALGSEAEVARHKLEGEGVRTRLVNVRTLRPLEWFRSSRNAARAS